MKTKLITAALIGLALGFIGSHVWLVGSGWSLLPWGVIGLALGVWARGFGQAALVGLVYGFALVFSFMVFGYIPPPSFISRVPIFLIFGAFGAVCGLILTLAGQVLAKALKLSHKKAE